MSLTQVIGSAVITAAGLGEVTGPQLVKLQIETMEREQLMPRATREFMLTFMEAQALEMGVTQETLMAKNALYRRVKQFDDQITALRAQL
ncbi:hypothetical protein [Acidovorax sp. K2F]|uniref:hypothetical protein n=1 Tax=Acidovorax sp. K2F TaxID=2978125 RepID=UPI0021B0E066|nr:hypothetical protein [Acidovorax sp. K2F]MCT6721743.1 hypothetical protein [Acidovorax sp. K2F]